MGCSGERVGGLQGPARHAEAATRSTESQGSIGGHWRTLLGLLRVGGGRAGRAGGIWGGGGDVPDPWERRDCVRRAANVSE